MGKTDETSRRLSKVGRRKSPHRVFCTGFLKKVRGDSRIRTGDPMLAKHVLYQLSYTPDEQKKPGWCPAFQ